MTIDITTYSCTYCRHFAVNGDGALECTQPNPDVRHRVVRGHKREYRYEHYAACKARLPLGIKPPWFEARGER